ncbi:hypothetical protein [uncultured Streptococcus sp.]|jgi:hypothetical protein|uniref:hypothetical protein n=1 Tax=uncultured Streptococcus sp. TaxID=83427 RepID=UPI00205FE698|nr:hypothetical protein [uncultured Streptococcus sp.]DAZ00384.1 MAG TPA: hypothetical protein [Caudoviricetes sp.]
MPSDFVEHYKNKKHLSRKGALKELQLNYNTGIIFRKEFGGFNMLVDILISVLVMVILIQMIIISSISERCKESKRELKKILNEKQRIEEARLAMRFGYRR